MEWSGGEVPQGWKDCAVVCKYAMMTMIYKLKSLNLAYIFTHKRLKGLQKILMNHLGSNCKHFNIHHTFVNVKLDYLAAILQLKYVLLSPFMACKRFINVKI